MFCSTVTSQISKEEKMRWKKTKTDDPEYQQKMKSKHLLNRVDAINPNYFPEEFNLKHPLKTTAITNSKSTYGSDADDPH